MANSHNKCKFIDKKTNNDSKCKLKGLKWSNWKSQAQNDNQLNLKDVITFLPKKVYFENYGALQRYLLEKGIQACLEFKAPSLPPLIGRWPKEIDVETYCELPRYHFRKGLAPHV